MLTLNSSQSIGRHIATLCLLIALSFSLTAATRPMNGLASTNAASKCGAQEEDTTPVPTSVCAPASRAKAALLRAGRRIAHHRFAKARTSLKTVRVNLSKAHHAAMGLIGAPPTDPESDDSPGPVSVLAVLSLEHSITMKVVPLFDAMTRTRVVRALKYTLWQSHALRNRMLDAVIALDPEGAGADYSDGMADTLATYDKEVKILNAALDQYRLSPDARLGLTRALARVQATQAKVNAAFGGGE